MRHASVLCTVRLHRAGAGMDIRSALGEPLRRIGARGGRFLAAATACSLLVGDLGAPGEAAGPVARRMAEVPWRAAGGRRARFALDHPQVRAAAPSGPCHGSRAISCDLGHVLGRRGFDPTA